MTEEEEKRRSDAAWEQAAKDADVTIELPNGVPMFFREIPAGEFRMGSRGVDEREEPVHRVVIPEPFFLGTFPVTHEQFAAFLPHHKSLLKNQPRNPADAVSWDEATAFCDWLSNRESVHGNWIARLPCETEWEYAARAGTQSDCASGDGEAALRETACFGEEFATGYTYRVGALAPNGWDLFDLHGNVLEWCEDIWDEKAYRKRTNGQIARVWDEDDAGPDKETVSGARPSRVLRGGSWYGAAWGCRSACRNWWWPVDRYWNRGFRVVLVPVPDCLEQSASAQGEDRAAGAGSDGTERIEERWGESRLPHANTKDKNP